MKRSTISQVFLYFLLIAFIVFSQCRKVNTTEMNRLAVNDITPTGGAGGDLVTITGEGFSLILTEDTVTFNGSSAQIKKVTDTSMEVVAPQGGSTGKVIVKVRNNIAEGPVFTYLASDAPQIISIDPAAGWDYTTTAVTIKGKNFGDDRNKVSVTFDGKSASIQSFSATTLIVAPPEHIPGKVPVIIQVNGISSNIVNYTYQQVPVINGATNQHW
ncbi:MAG TPA: IPT/TIG domain-containing protein, partial [Agriterribacter sp.]|nr:IPT/TIG domain-containing protein [Agriterribacter sp.]